MQMDLGYSKQNTVLRAFDIKPLLQEETYAAHPKHQGGPAVIQGVELRGSRFHPGNAL
jgi:hypothetical protein